MMQAYNAVVFSLECFKVCFVFSLECIWNLYLNALSLYVDMIFITQKAWEFNYMYGKTWTIMYNKNVKNFEILRSEITF